MKKFVILLVLVLTLLAIQAGVAADRILIESDCADCPMLMEIGFKDLAGFGFDSLEVLEIFGQDREPFTARLVTMAELGFNRHAPLDFILSAADSFGLKPLSIGQVYRLVCHRFNHLNSGKEDYFGYDLISVGAVFKDPSRGCYRIAIFHGPKEICVNWPDDWLRNSEMYKDWKPELRNVLDLQWSERTSLQSLEHLLTPWVFIEQ